MKISDRRLWIVLLGCLGMAAVNGCTCAEEPAPPPPQPAARPAPQPSDSAPPPPERRGPGTIEEQIAKEVELPPYYPGDAPIYPGARANTSTTGYGRVQAVFSTPDSQDQVLEWYRTALDEQGWQNLTETEAGEHKVITVDQGRRRFSIMVTAAAGHTLIIVSTDRG
jgi:hypothetical protein